MTFIKKQLEKLEKLFQPGRPLAKFYPVFEALDTFAFTPGRRTRSAPFVRDAVDLKRMMMFVIIALTPCIGMGIYNTGYQVRLALGLPLTFWHCIGEGLLKVGPIILVTYAAGGFWEVLFAVVRRHEINEGFLVTGMLFALIMPPTIPLWMVAVGVSFGVVIGKEIFGGTGFNVFNPALVGRCFLFFAFPAQFSGDGVWVAVDGYTRATPLAVLADAGRGGSGMAALHESGYSFLDMFFGFIPGVIGETSALACFLGLVFLLLTGVASWRIMLGCVIGLTGMSGMLLLFHSPETLTSFSLPPLWHLVMGGFAFGAVFMATDPVSSSATLRGRWIYGIMIGVLVVIIRVFNPAYTEGVMLAILFMNAFAPLIDHLVVEQHIQQRTKRLASFGRPKT